MIDRRTFGFGIGACGVWPQMGLAQAKGKIGYLHPVTISPGHITFSILQQAWHRLGYVDGQSVMARSAEGDLQRLPQLVSELITKGAGVLIVVGADAVRGAARTTNTTPLVAIDMETDPVRTGLIASYARPGGNVSGLFLDLPSLATKWIELLREAVPGLQRIALAWQSSTGREQLEAALAAARALSLETTILEIGPLDNFDATFASLASDKPSGIVQLTFPGITTVAQKFAAAAERRGLPTITFLRAAAKGGFLMSYGPSQESYFPRAVEIADKILRGEKVGDIPIERPAKFELVINLKTAKALGLTIPPPIIALADEVIE